MRHWRSQDLEKEIRRKQKKLKKHEGKDITNNKKRQHEVQVLFIELALLRELVAKLRNPLENDDG